ncbi:TetR/AcrR family transcriptional regulator [Bacillus sp. FJAT-49736]|uniref:TetR/AcrR family transcriptional regulator n=1 Tax=Bacillus sp. FJAT-49736 TaxID=2833582 RepID=UPI001BC8F8B5|nr:TetR/AcrR family transcriptional regulator [Bacillus sp. FJAT-49736]MBS4172952.1 TetR/AcrR family transcriptional regulator [Bacillus sp. FJAT-49736]
MPPIVSEEYKVNKKKAILESALKCFAQKGFELATIDDICALSGMSKGSIYNYFKTKDDIYIQLMNEQTKANFEFFQEKFKSITSAAGKLQILFETYREISLTEEFKNLILVHGEFWLSSSRKEDVRSIMLERYQNIYKNFVMTILEEGKENGEFKTDIDSSVIAALFWTIIDGICLDYAVIGDEYPYCKVFHKTEEMIFSLISR